MKALITGASGFIGSNLAERFVRAGFSVTGLVRRTSRLDYLSGIPIPLAYGDVTDRDSLSSAMRGTDIVVHVAGLASEWGRYEHFYEVNVSGTRNVAECALSSNVKRMVHISTTAIHGFPGFRYATEDTPLATTRWPYCETKKIAEQWLFKFSKSEGLPVSVIRPGNVFGRRDHTFFEKYAEILLKRQLGYINGGRSWTCPTYIENLSDAILQACVEPNAVGEAFVITDGLEIDWRGFTEKIADALGAKHPWYSIPFHLAYFGAMVMERIYESMHCTHAPILTRYRVSNGGKDYHFSIQKAKRLLGYQPIVSMDEAIRRTAEWYLKARGESAFSL